METARPRAAPIDGDRPPSERVKNIDWVTRA